MDEQAVRRVNVAACEVEHVPELPAGFRRGIAQVGERLGAARTALNVYDVPPGEAVGPYHYEDPDEEWLLVVAGRPTLRRPGGEDELEPWDVVFFPPGPDGAHMVRNDTDSTVRVLMFSSMTGPVVGVYPDSGKIAVFGTAGGADDIIVRRTSGVDYWEGESREPG